VARLRELVEELRLEIEDLRERVEILERPPVARIVFDPAAHLDGVP
jgi:hypothetical protein